MIRSEVTIDLGALRRNAETLVRTLEGAELWAVIKARAYDAAGNVASSVSITVYK